MIKIATFRSTIIAVLILCVSGMAAAEETKVGKSETEEKIETTVKEVSGEISGVSSNFIAILYGQDETASYEMAFSVGKDVKLVHKKSLSELAVGDTVTVSYEEKTKKNKEGKIMILSRVPKRISFIRAAPKALPETEESQTLQSQGEQNEN